jgi:heme-binding NEAT domain protein
LSVTYEANILSDLSDLVNTSWIDQTKYRVIGNEWDMKFVLDDHQASTTTIRGEIVDLSAVFDVGRLG